MWPLQETSEAALESRVGELERLIGQRSPSDTGPACAVASLASLSLPCHPDVVPTARRASTLQHFSHCISAAPGAALAADARLSALEVAFEELAAVATALDGDFVCAPKEVREVLERSESALREAEVKVEEETRMVDELLCAFNAETEKVNRRFSNLTALVESLERRNASSC